MKLSQFEKVHFSLNILISTYRHSFYNLCIYEHILLKWPLWITQNIHAEEGFFSRFVDISPPWRLANNQFTPQFYPLTSEIHMDELLTLAKLPGGVMTVFTFLFD